MSALRKDQYCLEGQMKVIAKTSPMLLYYEFNCPHCGVINVISKTHKTQVVLCSDKGCHKMIIIDNYRDIK